MAAEWSAWGVGSVSEHCASGIGAGEGWKATRSRSGDGGQGGVGRGTVSAPGGRAGTARVVAALVDRRAVALTA